MDSSYAILEQLNKINENLSNLNETLNTLNIIQLKDIFGHMNTTQAVREIKSMKRALKVTDSDELDNTAEQLRYDSTKVIGNIKKDVNK